MAGAVFASEVEPGLIGGDGAEEVGFSVERLEVKKLGLDGGVEGFDVGIGVGPCGRVEAVAHAGIKQAAMEAVGAVAAGVTVKLGSEIGADLDLIEGDAEAAQVLDEARAGKRGIGLGQLGGVGQEDGAGGLVPEGVLEPRQALGLHLGPVLGDVVEVLRVHLPAAQRRMLGLDPAQVRLAPVLLRAHPQQPLVAQDPVRGSLAHRQRKVLHQAPRPKTGRPLARRHHGLGRRLGALPRLAMGPPGSVHEPLVARGQEAPQPQAHRVARAAKTAPRTTDALRLSVDHQLPAQAKVLIDGRFHGQIESEPRVRKIGVHNQAFIMEAPDPHLFSREALPLGGGLPASASTPAFPSLAEQSTVLPSSPGQDLYRSDCPGQGGN
jgi:hypothetical protein